MGGVNMNLEKSWYWSRDEKKSVTRVRAVQTRLAWWKACKRVALNYWIDGTECNTGVFICIPFLFSLCITVHCECGWFKRKFPKTYAADALTDWSLGLTAEYICLRWADMDTMDSSTRTGFHWIASWEDIFKGGAISNVRDKPYAVHEESRFIKIGYPEKGNKPQLITFTVYKQNIHRYYRRWFPQTTVRYHVATDTQLRVPGDGENEWDLDDELIGGPFHEASESADLVVCAINPKAAIDQVVNDYYRRVGYRD